MQKLRKNVTEYIMLPAIILDMKVYITYTSGCALSCGYINVADKEVFLD